MKTVLASIVVLLASTSIANAESFTFASTATTTDRVGGPVAGGKPVGASMSSGESNVTYASGKKSTSKTHCANWSAPPGQLFTSTGFCTGEEGADKYTVAFSCQGDEKGGDCWGRLTGTGGAFQNKTGTVTWHGTQNADGKGGTATGQGAWN
jgi:hypothetical protein